MNASFLANCWDDVTVLSSEITTIFRETSFFFLSKIEGGGGIENIIVINMLKKITNCSIKGNICLIEMLK